MILSGREIIEARRRHELTIEPFLSTEVNPNSYNYHLASELLCISGQPPGPDRLVVEPEGFVLQPGLIYLGATAEAIGSSAFAMTLLGRSSAGRLGIFLNATADLGHVGSSSHWTLEISVVRPVRVYSGMRIGQVAFWEVAGAIQPYRGRYAGDVGPEGSKDSNLNSPYGGRQH